MEDRAKRAKKRADTLKKQFRNFHQYCQILAEFFWPERANFTLDRTPGVDMQSGLYSGDPQQLRRDFANRVGTVLRPTSEEWFRLTATPEEMMGNDQIRYWCDMVSRKQRRILYNRRGNYTHAMSIGDQEYVTFGNTVLWTAYNRMQDNLIFRTPHLRDCVWAEDEEGNVNELYETMSITLDQALALFGKERLPEEWRRKLRDKDGGLIEVKIIRAAVPIDLDQYEKGRRPPARMKTAIMYLACGSDVKDNEGALGEYFCEMFPYLVRRWMPLGASEPWGRSLCTNVALADARTQNVTEMAALKAIEMIADPPKWAEDEAVVGSFEVTPGGVTWVDTTGLATGRDPMGTIEGGEPRSAIDFALYKRNKMATIFFEHLWKFPDREMTAYETSERLQIMVEEATPVFQPMEADNGRHMDIVFSKSDARGAFPPPPESLLEQGQVEWEFETPITTNLRKMRAMKARAMIDDVAVARQVIPTFGDEVNWVEVEREWAAGKGPENWILPREVAQQNRDQRAQAQIEMQQDQEMLETARIAAGAKPENLRMIEEAGEG